MQHRQRTPAARTPHNPGLLRKLVLACFPLALIAHAGCLAPRPAPQPQAAEETTHHGQEELRERLNDFVNFVQSTVEAATADIERKSPDKDCRQAAALWRIRIMEECHTIVDQDDPREILIDLWALCYRTRDYLVKGEGKSIFGHSQPQAVECAEKLCAAFENIAQQFVPPNTIASLREKVVTHSAAHPIRGQWDMAPSERLSDTPEIGKKLGDLVALPFAPLRAIEAVGRTPDSIHDASMAVRRFSEVLADLPASTRWEMQLLGMSLDESPTVSGSVASFKTLSDSSARLADNSTRFVQVIDALPEKTRKEAEILLKSLDEMKGVDRTISDATGTATAVEHAAHAVTEATREILKFVPSNMKDATGQIIGDAPAVQQPAPQPAMLQPVAAQQATLPPASPSSAPPPPADAAFSFQAVTQSATELGATTDKLRLLVADLRWFADSGTADATTARLQALVDHAAKRLIQVIVSTFVLAVLYRLVTARLRPPRAS